MFEEPTDHVILAQVNGAVEDEPEEENDDKGIVGQEVSAVYLQKLGRNLIQSAVPKTTTMNAKNFLVDLSEYALILIYNKVVMFDSTLILEFVVTRDLFPGSLECVL